MQARPRARVSLASPFDPRQQGDRVAGLGSLMGVTDALPRSRPLTYADLVAHRADLGEDNLRHTPVLVVEVLSPSTRHVDQGTKRLAFEAAGVPSYWVVDPDAPDLLVLELEDGSYREVVRVARDEPFEAMKPHPVRVVPADLLK